MDLIVGTSLSVIDALLPIVILRTCQEKCDAFPTDSELEDSSESRQVAARIIARLRQGSSTFWPVLRNASLLSSFFTLALVFVTGEASHVHRDSYVLDMTCVKQLFFFSGVLNGTLLVTMSLLVMATSPVMPSFLTAFSNAIQIGVFCKSNLVVYNWLGLAGCWFFSVCFVLAQLYSQWRGEKKAIEIAPARNGWSILRTITVILVLCVSISGIARISWDHTKAPALGEPECQMRESLNAELRPAQDFKFNSTVNDAYLGSRPDVDTVADLQMILERCIEVEGGLGVDDVINCAKFLAQESDKYLSLPSEGERASERTPQDTALDNGSQKSMLTHYVKPSEAEPASKTSMGTCPGPIFPFHVYWTGPATWRLELFVKAYLTTQNLPCSRLYIWLDADVDSSAVDRMLCDDPIFRRFLPLVSRGDIQLKSWNLPSRIPIPKSTVPDAQTFHPHLHGQNLEMPLADNIIQDGTGKWLLLDPSLAHFTPVQISDAVRFVVLHLHGGVYLDMDVMLLRDLRPLLLQPHSFAEQWVERCPRPDFNTAVISVPANSSLSTYLLRGAVRMGMNFHPKVIGRMMLGDGRIEELAMLQNAVFDPLVTDLRRKGTENCTVPCHKNFEQVFRAEVDEPEKEWSAFEGAEGEGAVVERTMDKFFRGSFAYHIHNQVSLLCFSSPFSSIERYTDNHPQWQKFPEPTSWMDVITASQDGFFEGSRANVYGEKWEGPVISEYDRDTWPGF